MYEFIIWLRFIGCLLVTNSHLGLLYPIADLSVGGTLGNVLFFLSAGFCVSNKNNNFINWYKKRLLRIYPPLTVANICLGNIFKVDNFFDFLRIFIYPTLYWFVGAILLFYPILFLCIKYFNSKEKIQKILVLIAIVYFFVYIFKVNKSFYSIEGEGYFKWIFYLGVMITGYYFKIALRSESKNIESHSTVLLALSILMVILHLAVRVGCEVIPLIRYLQWLVHLFALGFGICLFYLGVSIESKLRAINIKIRFIIALIGNSALEIYLLTQITYLFKGKFFFPINIFMAVTTLMISGVCLRYFIKHFTNRGK